MTLSALLYFDGASKGNPGPGGGGWVINQRTETIAHGWDFLPHCTNNEAEYLGLISALECMRDFGHTLRGVIIRGDSKLVIMQIQNKWKCTAENLVPLRNKAMGIIAQLIKEGKDVKYEHIPREENSTADALANLGTKRQTSERSIERLPKRLTKDTVKELAKQKPAKKAIVELRFDMSKEELDEMFIEPKATNHEINGVWVEMTRACSPELITQIKQFMENKGEVYALDIETGTHIKERVRVAYFNGGFAELVSPEPAPEHLKNPLQVIFNPDTSVDQVVRPFMPGNIVVEWGDSSWQTLEQMYWIWAMYVLNSQTPIKVWH